MATVSLGKEIQPFPHMEDGKRNGTFRKKQNSELMRFDAVSPAVITKASTRSAFRNIGYRSFPSLWKRLTQKSVLPPMLRSPLHIFTVRQTSVRESTGKRRGQHRLSMA